ncbi:response regulator transcription factor [Streptacidiphilus sp. P02-A3a]|uniref:response regulator n=1 Tax=Streptacidiphilus sp. P02-A3a TaxID=2704468 RepID=UPI0015F83DC0|nr:response regulator transcription factor [Streptacidiphilus sp. P02-A3a]QMU73264.1 response regulator transcription factor [Streptacidiphilus sp. P02-A3a]
MAPTTGPGRIRILAADDHGLLRAALCELLCREPDLTVVAQAADGAAAVALAAEHRPDVVLLDVEMPGPGPVATVERLRQVSPLARIIVLTMHGDLRLMESMLGAGVTGYLHKDASREVLLSSIRGAVAGLTTVHLRREPGEQPAPGPGGGLTPREHEIMTYVADALSNRQIGNRLSIAEGTVKRHLGNIFEKLGASSRIDAVNKLFGQSSYAIGTPDVGHGAERHPPLGEDE